MDLPQAVLVLTAVGEAEDRVRLPARRIAVDVVVVRAPLDARSPGFSLADVAAQVLARDHQIGVAGIVPEDLVGGVGGAIDDVNTVVVARPCDAVARVGEVRLGQVTAVVAAVVPSS